MEADRSDKPAYVQNYQLDQQEINNQPREELRTLLSVDDAVDALMQNLTANGEADNTLAFFVSDNGYMFGEHNIDAKNRPYLDSIRVPMYMRWPGEVPAGATDSRLIALVDLAPTVLSATGLSSTIPMDGRDLLDPTWQRDRMLTEFSYQGDVPTWVSLVTAGSQYTEYFNRDDPNSVFDREYYDLGADPYELDNLLSDSAPPTTRRPPRCRRRSRRIATASARRAPDCCTIGCGACPRSGTCSVTLGYCGPR